MTDQPMARPLSARPRNGLGVAALVLGVASLVAAVSFVLFPLGLLGGLVALILGVIALSRGSTGGMEWPCGMSTHTYGSWCPARKRRVSPEFSGVIQTPGPGPSAACWRW